MMTEWKAAIDRTYTPMEYRLHAWRPVGNGYIEYVIGVDSSGRLATTRREASTVAEGHDGVAISPEMFEAVARAFAEYVEPTPIRAEVERLEQALAVERARVDQLVAAASSRVRRPNRPPLPPSTMTTN